MPERSRSERGWRLAGLGVLFVIACFWMPLGARDAGGVSSVIPALRPSTLSQPSQAVAHPSVQPHAARRPAPVRSRVLLAVVAVVALALLVHLVVATGAVAGLRPRLLPGVRRSRAPPVLV